MSKQKSSSLRLAKEDFQKLSEKINKDEFYTIFCENGNSYVCEYFSINLNTMYKLVKFFNIELTDEQRKHRNKVATEQRVFALYGVKNNFQRPEIKEKIRQTNIKNLGVENPFQSEKVKEKIRTKINKDYGVNYPTQSEAIKQKIKQNNLIKYGVPTVSRLVWVRQKMASTCAERYGTACPLKNSEIREKIKQTNIKKYGVSCSLQAPEIIKHRHSIYVFDGLFFDSIPELAVYVFFRDNNINIIRLPTVFTYSFEDKEHKYFPDFEIAGKLVEIKGEHFFKADGTMCNPYDHTKDALYEAKHQCMIKNNVEIWTSDKYKSAVSYFMKNYELNKFKYKNEESENEFI